MFTIHVWFNFDMDITTDIYTLFIFDKLYFMRSIYGRDQANMHKQ